jgi:hypothetical protein
MVDDRETRGGSLTLRPRCSCGRLVRTHNNDRRIGWFAYGEHGSEEGWVCPRCAEIWTPRDGMGRGPEAGYCGFITPAGRATLEERREP